MELREDSHGVKKGGQTFNGEGAWPLEEEETMKKVTQS